MTNTLKLEGFDGEIRIVVPPVVINTNIQSELLNAMYVTDIGYYPKAKNHFCIRGEGCIEHILLHCVDGRGRVTIEENIFDLEANQYILIPAGMPHGYRADEENPWTIYWMHFAGTHTAFIIEGIFERVLSHRNILVFDGEVQRIFNRVCRLLENGYSKENLHHIALSLPYFLSGYLHPHILRDDMGQAKDVIGISLEFLKRNICNRIGLKEIASNVNLSVPHFSKIFKSRTGYSPIEYLNHLKIQKACYELQFSDKRIVTISYELGFEDQYYFSRLFKYHMGLSPQGYRNNLINK